jgi:hypothetical protein
MNPESILEQHSVHTMLATAAIRSEGPALLGRPS